MPVLTAEGLAAQVHADRYATRLVDNHIRSTRSNPLSGAGAAVLTSNGPTIRAVPNPLPSGAAAYIPEAIEIMSSNAGGPYLLYEAFLLGTIDTSGSGTFTDGTTFPVRKALGANRQLSGPVLLECATDMVSQRTITLTYVNQDGTSGRTSAGHAVTVNALKNSTGIVVLQAGDVGVQDVTAVAISGGTSPTGTIRLWGILPIALVPGAFGLPMLTKNLIAEGVVRRLGAGSELRILRFGTQSAERAIGQLRFIHDTSGSPPAGNSRPLDSVANLLTNQCAYGELAVGLNVRHTPATTAATETSGYVSAQGWDRDYIVSGIDASLDGAVVANYGAHQAARTDQLLCWKTILGTLTVAGNSFAAGSAMPSRKHYGRSSAEQTVSTCPGLYIKTTFVGAVSPTVTIGYTNQDGVSGRTCTMTLPATQAAGSLFFMGPHLQSGDSGIISVQSISISGGTSGVAEVWGLIDVANELLFSAGGGQNVQVAMPFEPPLLQNGDLLNVIRVNSATSTGQWCNFDLIGVAP